MHQIKPELKRQDLEGIQLPSFRFSIKLKKLCQVLFFCFLIVTDRVEIAR
jgi:hypothetical protein